MKVGFVCSDYPPEGPGGIAVFTQNLARALAARGHQVRAIDIRAGRRPVRLREADDGILSDQTLASRLSEGGRRKAETAFAFDRWVSRNEAFYDQVITRYRSLGP